MNPYEKIYNLLLEKETKAQQTTKTKKKVTSHYMKVRGNPEASKEEKKEAKQYFERGSKWVDKTARKNYPRGNKK